jgi:hypothetical protein
MKTASKTAQNAGRKRALILTPEQMNSTVIGTSAMALRLSCVVLVQEASVAGAFEIGRYGFRAVDTEINEFTDYRKETATGVQIIICWCRSGRESS